MIHEHDGERVTDNGPRGACPVCGIRLMAKEFAEFSAVGFEEAARVFAVFRDGAVFDKVDA
jgi:hypothetical protein